MADFKPGDEVTLVKDTAWQVPVRRRGFWRSVLPKWRYSSGPAFGEVLVVADITIKSLRSAGVDAEGECVFLRFSPWPTAWFSARNFRKVQRRSIECWLETSTDFEEPKRTPADAESVPA